MTSQLSEILIRVIEKSLKERINPWIHSSHEIITKLEIDARGEAGENFMATCLRQNGHKVEIDRTTDPQEKSWDIRVDDNIMIEIKEFLNRCLRSILRKECLLSNSKKD